MSYRKITIELIVPEDDAVSVHRELEIALERVDEHHTLYRSEIREEDTGEPENGSEIDAPVVEPAIETAAPGEESTDDGYDKG
jgi:hypothetical protein